MTLIHEVSYPFNADYYCWVSQNLGWVGVGYYSYLYARCFAATIWQESFVENPLSFTTGSALRSKFLQHGGAKDPADLLKDFVGDGVLRYCGGGIVPNTSSLCKEMNM